MNLAGRFRPWVLDSAYYILKETADGGQVVDTDRDDGKERLYNGLQMMME